MIDSTGTTQPSDTTKLLLGGVGVLVVGGFVVAAASMAQRQADGADKLKLAGVPVKPPVQVPPPSKPPIQVPPPSKPPAAPVGGLATPMTATRVPNARPGSSSRPIKASAFGFSFFRAHLQSAVDGRRMSAARAQQLLTSRRDQYLAAGVADAELPTTLFTR